uniref:NADH dehydrogenase [ubiquinone] 1 beta subcomplex subunit 10 n=1 Tax=Strongyloides venezuelensis TaxID=75913 RepID=A0A0K0G1K4_STRVS
MIGVGEVNETLTPIQRRRLQDRKEWEAYWKVRKLESEGTFFPAMRYYAQRAFDFPATFVRENIVEPLHDKYKKPYYHRRFNRVPEIDQCGVNDMACFYEANEQYRLDKLVDGNILDILKQRVDRCLNYDERNINKCANVIEDMEESELNFFIKYGEMGSEADCRDVYMKQKHRMIWERRHPEIMAERERLYKEHKEKLKAGKFDYSFWKKGMFFQDKKNCEAPYEFVLSKSTLENDKPLSRDWNYYKKVKEDPEFDKEQGKTSNFRIV